MRTTIVVVLTVIFLAQIVACDSYSSGDEFDFPQTDILDVRVEPNPSTPGASITLTTIIEDSLDTSFEFIWDFHSSGERIITDTNQVEWVVPDVVGRYTGEVSADNGDETREPGGSGFIIDVRE